MCNCITIVVFFKNYMPLFRLVTEPCSSVKSTVVAHSKFLPISYGFGAPYHAQQRQAVQFYIAQEGGYCACTVSSANYGLLLCQPESRGNLPLALANAILSCRISQQNPTSLSWIWCREAVTTPCISLPPLSVVQTCFK